MAARALDEQTDALPRIGLDHLDVPPTALGKSTVAAIEAGLYWGTIGAIRELIGQLSIGQPSQPEVFVTGGASPHVAQLLARNNDLAVQHVPHLVLSGIALVGGTLGGVWQAPFGSEPQGRRQPRRAGG
jgi:type III pantothenate kinase